MRCLYVGAVRPIDYIADAHFAQLDLPCFAVQDEDDILENVAQKFHRIFTRDDHFKVGCALCILLCDNLLTRTQVRP